MNRQKLRVVVFAEQDRAAMVATRNHVEWLASVSAASKEPDDLRRSELPLQPLSGWRSLCEKGGRPLNQPVSRHDADAIGDGPIEPVKCSPDAGSLQQP
jgi:hypothetical protein